MDTITTIQSLLTFNGSARAVTVALTPNELSLIAAAPELLEALQLFLTEYVALVNSGDAGFWDAENEEKVKKARAAIAKATGEQA